MTSRTRQISAAYLIYLIIAGCGEDNPTTTLPPPSSCDTCQAEVLYSSKVNTSELNGAEYVDMVFTDSAHIFIGYRRGTAGGTDREMKIARSSDGGHTWIEDDVTPADLDSDKVTYPRLHLAATQTQVVGGFGWGVPYYDPGTARILSTIDNGLSYSHFDQSHSCLLSALNCRWGECYGYLFSDRSSSIYLCGSMDGWLANCGLLRLRADASAFDSVPSPSSHASFFACNDHLWAVASMIVYHSSDRGASWQTTGTLAPGESPLVTNYAAYDQGLFAVWLTPELGKYTMKSCYVTPDSIFAVQVIDTVQTYYEIPTHFFVRDLVVCMCTWRNQDPLYRTTDSGLTWLKHRIPSGLESVDFIPSALTWVNETTLYYTVFTDGEIRFYCVRWEL